MPRFQIHYCKTARMICVDCIMYLANTPLAALHLRLSARLQAQSISCCDCMKSIWISGSSEECQGPSRIRSSSVTWIPDSEVCLLVMWVTWIPVSGITIAPARLSVKRSVLRPALFDGFNLLIPKTLTKYVFKFDIGFNSVFHPSTSLGYRKTVYF